MMDRAARYEWMLDLYRLFQSDEDETFPSDILDALELAARSDDPEWKARRLPEHKEV